MEYQWNNNNGYAMHVANNPANYWQPRPMFPSQPMPPFPPPQQLWMGFQGNAWPTPPGNYHAPQRHPIRNRFPNNNRNKSRNRKEPVFIDFCDVCDRGFKNEAKKIEHFSQHIKCDEPDCNFEAHFKIVTIHKQNLHGPNARKIKLDTPEEIEKWRMERKRNFPTIANVERKLQKSLERQKTGIILENKNFGKMRKRKRSNNKFSTKAVNDVTELISSEEPNKVQKKTEPKNFLISEGVEVFDDSDSPDDSQNPGIAVDVKAGQSVGLGSLMQSYASDSEDDQTDNKNLSGKGSQKMTFSTKKSTNPPRGPETEVKPTEYSENQKSPANFKNHKQRTQNRNGQSGQKYGGNLGKNKRKNLLEMLLASDIRRERNYILQCVRFIVKNNFLEDDVSAG